MTKRADQSRYGLQAFDPKTFLASEGRGRVISKYAPQEVIFAQGDVADSVFYIRKGKVKLSVISTEGKEAVFAILDANQFAGEGCLIGQTKRLASATAMMNCDVTRIKKEEILGVMHDQPDFAMTFVLHILLRSARIRKTWSISSSIQPRSGWRASFSCWPILARKAGPSRSCRK